MHGLINKAFQCYVRDTFGQQAWLNVARHAGLDFDSFETLADYSPMLTPRIVDSAVAVLARPRESLFEDMGTYLVSHQNTEAVRRLLRFGGSSFVDFLGSLDELPDRARLALADLYLPNITLTEQDDDSYCLHIRTPLHGSGHIMVGLLRAMADDYGALAVMEHQGKGRFGEVISIQILEHGFAEGREFALAMAGGGMA